jgi:carbamoyl-phosphate synthase large subunit
MKKILITGIGGPTSRSIAKTIRKGHPESILIGIDANPKAIGFFIPGLIDKYLQAPKITDIRYWPFINDLLIAEAIDITFVQPETEVIGWGVYFNENGRFPSPVLIPPYELASVLIDKSRMAAILEGTEYIPKTLKITQSQPNYKRVGSEIGYPCWIRATKGSGGLGSLRLIDKANYKSWLFINSDIVEFTVSEYLPGRHLATQMLYIDGEYIKGASLECAEYVMASIAPSKVTGNTSFGRLLNEDRILLFCDSCIRYICEILNIKPHGVLSFDLKEDAEGNLKVTEVNIRHMAYTGVMADAGFNLTEDTINYLLTGTIDSIRKEPYFKFHMPYVFLRDVDTLPVLLENEELFKKNATLL